MESRDGKRKKDKHSDGEENRKEKKSRRNRSRSRSPDDSHKKTSRRKRRHSRSRSPRAPLKNEKHNNPPKETGEKKEAPVRKTKETDMLNTRTGGAYIPPARLRMMQAQITDKSSIAYQRLAWEALKKSIHGHINKINVGNIGIIIKELLKENIVRGRGLLCRSVIQAQAASPTFTNVYAALVAAVNSRFPNIGELLLKRLVIQFKRGFKRNDKPTCISSASFIAHLVNQRVAHEILALELLTLLVETPTDDSVEVAIAFLKESGQKLTEVSSKGVNAIFEMLRNILHEGQLDKRVQYMIEVMFQVWKDGFKDHPALIEELELVPEEEQFTHLLMLDDATDPQDILNVFKFDEKYEENEQKYKTLSKEILGSDVESGEEEGSDGSGSEEEDEDEDEESEQKPVTIIDNTETNLVALRRTIYLTINSSLDFEECAHKLMKMQLKPGQEVELCHMFLDCCAEQRTYEKFYGLLAQRFCNINRIYIEPFEEIFKDSYSTAHRLDTNRLRNVSKFFAHLLFTDSISWEVLTCVRLNEEDTTSSSRIYIKILFQELAEYMGLKKLNDRLKDPTLQEAFSGVFPRDNPKNTRFSINFFTSIGLGGLTDELREHLKQLPKNVPAPITEIKLDSDSSSDSSSSSSSSSDDSSSSDSSSSESEEEANKKKSKKSKKTKDKNNKTPKTPEESETQKDTERWGHDGFYDTYGKDARRMESRPDRREEFDRQKGSRKEGQPREFERNGDHRRGQENWDSDRLRHDDRDQGRGRRDDRVVERESRGGRGEDRGRPDDGGRERRRRDESDDDWGRREDRGKRDDREEARRIRDEFDETRERRNDRQDKEKRGERDEARGRRDDKESKERRDDRAETTGKRAGIDNRERRCDKEQTRGRRDDTNEVREKQDDKEEARGRREEARGRRDDRDDAREKRDDRDDAREKRDDREEIRERRYETKERRECREETKGRRDDKKEDRSTRDDTNSEKRKRDDDRRKRDAEEDNTEIRKEKGRREDRDDNRTKKRDHERMRPDGKDHDKKDSEDEDKKRDKRKQYRNVSPVEENRNHKSSRNKSDSEESDDDRERREDSRRNKDESKKRDKDRPDNSRKSKKGERREKERR